MTPSIEEAVSNTMNLLEGAYSLVLMSSTKMIAARDSYGFRPLCYGKMSDGAYVVVPDRKEAIRYCMEHAKEGDIIVLAGKGHENYQEVKGIKYLMDERELIADIIKENPNIKL